MHGNGGCAIPVLANKPVRSVTVTYEESQSAMVRIQFSRLEGESLDFKSLTVYEGAGPCPKDWAFFSPGVAQQRVC